MPLRSLSSSVLRWPDRDTVHRAAAEWAEAVADENVVAMGYMGSYATGDWGVGSDLDLVLIVSDSDAPFIERAARFDTTPLPVPADLLVYTLQEWRKLLGRGGRFAGVLRHEVVWLKGLPEEG